MSPPPSTEHLLFNTFVDALIVRGYGEKVTPRLKARLREHGLDLDAKLLPGYPARLLAPWLGVLAGELYATESGPRAQELIGRRFIAGWRESLLGRATAPLIKLLSQRRALGRMERNFRSTDNFTRIEVVDVGPTAVKLGFNDICDAPDFYVGLLDEGSSLSSARNARCRLLGREGAGATFLCEWDP